MIQSHPRWRSVRLARAGVTFAAIVGLALSTPALVSAQPTQTSPGAAQQAPVWGQDLGSKPPVRTDTTVNAAPMPADAAPVPSVARSREVGQQEISAQAWTKRPPANRQSVEPPRVDWAPTDQPMSRVALGEMRSDREEIPEGFTKADADKAETMEAALTAQRSDMGIMAAPGCQVYWPAPFEVCGAIRDKYNALGGPNSFLLFPKTNEITNPDGIGKRTEFQNGPIYWSPQGGAHPVVNHFLAAWARLGYENSYIGYPTTDEIVNADGIGRRQHFTGSTIYWRLNEAYSVGGAIADKWNSLGAERTDGLLGYPTSDEEILPDGVGRMNTFQRGVIYWHPTTGAQAVTNHLAAGWARNGWETGDLGYPTADETSTSNGLGRMQPFQHGRIYASPEGTVAGVHGAILDKWLSINAENGYLGYPILDEEPSPTGVGRFTTFENGLVYWNPATGAHPMAWPILAEWIASGTESGTYGAPIEDMQVNHQNRTVSQKFERGQLVQPAIHVYGPNSRPPSIMDNIAASAQNSPSTRIAQDEFYCQMWTEEVHASHHMASRGLNVRGGTDCQGRQMRELRHSSFRIYEDRWWGGDIIGQHTGNNGQEGNFNFGATRLSINASSTKCNNGMKVWATLRGSAVDQNGNFETGKFDSFQTHGVQEINDCAT